MKNIKWAETEFFTGQNDRWSGGEESFNFLEKCAAFKRKLNFVIEHFEELVEYYEPTKKL